jgi:hypothetical protein
MFRKARTGSDMADIRDRIASMDPAQGELDRDSIARLAGIGERMGAQAIAGPAPGRRERAWWPGRPALRRRRAMITFVAVPALLAASAAGWAIAHGRTASQVTDGIACYAAPRFPSSAAIVSATGQSPAMVCAQIWAEGAIPGRHGSHVPPLVSCVLPAGDAVGVFPDTSCAALRLQPLPGGYQRAAAAFSALVDHLDAQLSRSKCVSEPQATAYARQALRAYGFTGWRVTGYRPGPGTRCAMFAADSERHTILVTSVPGQGVEAVQVPGLRPRSRCTAGHPPESTRVVLRKFRAALRAAGYGQWKVVVGSPASRAQPCYGGVSYDPAHRTISLDSTASLTR